MGESVVEATVGRWLKQEGDAVALGEPLADLETDKVNVTVTAEDAGVMGKILKAAGETVAIGDIIGLIEAGAGADGAPPAPAPAAPEPPAPEPAPAAPAPVEAAAEPSGNGTEAPKVRATPLAERVAEELKVDLAAVPAGGPGGRVTREDVQAFARTDAPAPTPVAAPAPPPSAAPAPAAEAPPAPAPPPPAPTIPAPVPVAVVPGLRTESRRRLSRRRLTIARRLVEAQHTAAMLTTFNEVDMTAVMALRNRWKERFKERHGVGLGFMSFFTKAVIGALRAFPQVNAELQGDELVLKDYYDIGIAIGDEEGLVVPILRNAEQLTFAQIEQAILHFVQKTKTKTLTVEDLKGGTFTITNGGVFGSLLSTPILNPPQVAILGMHKIQERPVAVDGQVVVRPMMYVALSYDHRIVDGREAVQFLVKVKEQLEDPSALLLDT